MILAIDAGNTNIVLGCIADNDILFAERVSTDTSKTELEYVETIKILLDLYNINSSDIDGCIISSVVPPLTYILKSAVAKYLKLDAMIVGPGIKTELNIKMDNPAQVGADLIVNAVAGLSKYGAPLIMIDMGTATTVSVLDENNCYIGGMILPGVLVSIEALVQSTSQLPRIGLDKPKKVLGKNTVDSMKSGIIYSQASAIDGIIDRIKDELGYDCQVVATGGLASRIVPYCKKDVIVDNDLTLSGLNLIYKKNINRK